MAIWQLCCHQLHAQCTVICLYFLFDFLFYVFPFYPFCCFFCLYFFILALGRIFAYPQECIYTWMYTSSHAVDVLLYCFFFSLMRNWCVLIFCQARIWHNDKYRANQLLLNFPQTVWCSCVATFLLKKNNIGLTFFLILQRITFYSVEHNRPCFTVKI